MLLTETQKRSETAQKQGKFVSHKDAVEGFLSQGAASSVVSLRGAAQHCSGGVCSRCCDHRGSFWNRAVVSAGGASSEQSDPVSLLMHLINGDLWKDRELQN